MDFVTWLRACSTRYSIPPSSLPLVFTLFFAFVQIWRCRELISPISNPESLRNFFRGIGSDFIYFERQLGVIHALDTWILVYTNYYKSTLITTFILHHHMELNFPYFRFAARSPFFSAVRKGWWVILWMVVMSARSHAEECHPFTPSPLSQICTPFVPIGRVSLIHQRGHVQAYSLTYRICIFLFSVFLSKFLPCSSSFAFRSFSCNLSFMQCSHSIMKLVLL